MKHAILCAAAIAVMLCNSAHAQNYPSRPIRIVNSSAPGGGADILVRHLATRVQALAGQPVIIENKPGANGNIANELVVSAKPDGYTVLYAASSAVIANRYVMKGVTFDPMKDLEPVANTLRVGLVLAIPPNSPARTLPEFIEHLKSKTGKVLYGIPTTSVLAASELFKITTGTTGQPVNYKSMMDSAKDVTSGETDYTFIDATAGTGQAKAGRLRILGISTARRLASLPDLPTLSEAGLKDYQFVNFWGVWLPAKSPPEAITKLNAWFTQVVKTEETQKFLTEQASEPATGTPDDLRREMLEHDAMWKRIVSTARIEPQ